MHASFIKNISNSKSVNKFEYRWKMWKYLHFAYDKLDMKCQELRLNTIDCIILNNCSVWKYPNIKTGCPHFNNRSINVKSWIKNTLVLNTTC